MASANEVFDYWEAQTCGTIHARSEPGTRRYYEDIETQRYRAEPFIRDFAQFPRWRGKRVLEIGVGAGTDFINFAREGALLTGVDLTPAAVDHARRRLRLEGLEADVRIADAQALPFEDQSFELVYSWGVIHHAPNPPRIVREVRRLLAPDGEARIMLYGRHSWAAYRCWMRASWAAKRPVRSLSAAIATHMESPGTQAYTRREIQLLFAGAGFEQIAIEGFLTPYDRRRIGPMAAWIRQDFFLGVTAA
jgi:SAM-dependent methyltransferase